MLTSALYLIQAIELKLPVSFINQKINIACNYEDIERNVCTN